MLSDLRIIYMYIYTLKCVPVHTKYMYIFELYRGANVFVRKFVPFVWYVFEHHPFDGIACACITVCVGT